MNDIEEKVESTVKAFDDEPEMLPLPSQTIKCEIMPLMVTIDDDIGKYHDIQLNDIVDMNYTPKDNGETLKEASMEFQGFSTGAGRKITVSRESIDRVKSFFTESDAFENLRNESEVKLNETSIPFTVDLSSNQFCGFKTSSGKDIKISDESKSRVKGIFGDIYDDFVPGINPFDANSKGFQSPMTFENTHKHKITLESNTAVSKIFGDSNNNSLNNNGYVSLMKSTPFTPLVKRSGALPISGSYTPVASKKLITPVFSTPMKRNLFETPDTHRCGLLRQTQSSRTFATPRTVNQTPQSTYKAFKIPLISGFTPSARPTQVTPMILLKPKTACINRIHIYSQDR